MHKSIDLTGKIFGRLSVIKKDLSLENKRSKWLCRCICGNEKIVLEYSLKNGDTQSCGCIHIENTKLANTKHGLTNTRTYNIWMKMNQRCLNKNCLDYPNWGGRGISVCEKWLGRGGFENFVKDMGQPPTDKHQIDRIDNNGDYCKENCRWSTQKEQSRNRKNNLLFSYNDEIKCLSEWGEKFDIPYGTLYKRIVKYKWDIAKAIETPLKNINATGVQYV